MKKATYKQILDGIHTARKNYEKCLSSKAISPSVDAHLSNRYAMLHYCEVILASKSAAALSDMVEASQSWLRDVEEAEAESRTIFDFLPVSI